jgi:hypothetical protein
MYLLFVSDFNEIEFCGHSLKITSNIKFHENLSSGSRVFPCGQTDGQMNKNYETNIPFSQFSEHAYKFYVLPTVGIFAFYVVLRTQYNYLPINQ